MKLLFVNAKGGGNFQKMVQIVNFFTNANADIVFICETHFTPEKLQRYEHNWPNFAWYNNSPYGNQSGIVCIIRDTIRTPTSTTRIVEMDTEGRILGIKWGDELNISYPVSREEVLVVMGKWKNGSTPGPSGIPYELFKEFVYVGYFRYGLFRGFNTDK